MKKEYDLSYVIEEFVEKFDQESELNLSEFSKQVLRDGITEWDYIHTPKPKDEDMVNTLTNDGWNVKILSARDPDETPTNYIQVKVSFDYYPPSVYIISGKHKTQLDEDTINLLDSADIQKVDLTIRPYQWEVNGKTGVKAYLKTMYVTIFEDEFADEYRDIGEPFEEVHAEDVDELDIPF